MTISPGAHLGPYEILEAIGAGGMGEVYKARDTRLNRTIAIKILPQHLSENLELRQRFGREAQAIAALNHPNICVLHDVGDQDGTDYLVMEFLEGQTLATRLARGPLPVDEAVRYAIQIADALDKAHSQGVTHRDLKPGNVMLTKSGAKHLDFGLAKLRLSKDVGSESGMPTADEDLTAHGTVLETVQYMAPEQIEGEEVDARSDIFAFGVVLYEMITGKKAFEGKSRAGLMAAILRQDPTPMSAFQVMTPLALHRLVEICLAKDPTNRWQTAHDMKLQLQWIAESPKAGTPAPLVRPGKNRTWLPWSLLAAAVSLLIAAGAYYYSRPPAEVTPVRFSIFPTNGSVFGPGQRSPYAAISPDGRRLVYPANEPQGPTRLWVRALDSLESHPLPGTEAITPDPFWSPDSRQIAFFAAGKLKKAEFSGGPVQEVCCKALPTGGEGTWNTKDTILFNSPNGLFSVPAAGGDPVQVRALDASLKETGLRTALLA